PARAVSRRDMATAGYVERSDSARPAKRRPAEHRHRAVGLRTVDDERAGFDRRRAVVGIVPRKRERAGAALGQISAAAENTTECRRIIIAAGDEFPGRENLDISGA